MTALSNAHLVHATVLSLPVPRHMNIWKQCWKGWGDDKVNEETFNEEW